MKNAQGLSKVLCLPFSGAKKHDPSFGNQRKIDRKCERKLHIKENNKQ